MRNGSFLLLGILLFPLAASANGGMQKVAEGKYIVNVSSAPIAPYAGETQKMLIGFADISGNLIQKDIRVDLTLKYEREPVVEQRNLIAENGVLPFQYTYGKPGIYELFVQFRLPEEPDHTYIPEDFLIEVKEKFENKPAQPSLLIGLLGGGILGLLLGFALAKWF